ncbi:MAG: hypothetical protein KDD62_07220 [Bdellovibrionales bacterium]|nr:hypothetical protein [Bdellovibrionales bacterium]
MSSRLETPDNKSAYDRRQFLGCLSACSLLAVAPKLEAQEKRSPAEIDKKADEASIPLLQSLGETMLSQAALPLLNDLSSLMVEKAGGEVLPESDIDAIPKMSREALTEMAQDMERHGKATFYLRELIIRPLIFEGLFRWSFVPFHMASSALAVFATAVDGCVVKPLRYEPQTPNALPVRRLTSGLVAWFNTQRHGIFFGALGRVVGEHILLGRSALVESKKQSEDRESDA